jgi:hypothetical protein
VLRFPRMVGVGANPSRGPIPPARRTRPAFHLVDRRRTGFLHWMPFGVQTHGRRILSPRGCCIGCRGGVPCRLRAAVQPAGGRFPYDRTYLDRLLLGRAEPDRARAGRLLALYPQANWNCGGHLADAVSALFAAQCDLAVLTRDCSRRALRRRARRSEVEGYPIARDAVVAVVNAANPVENMTLPDPAEHLPWRDRLVAGSGRREPPRSTWSSSPRMRPHGVLRRGRHGWRAGDRIVGPMPGSTRASWRT